MAARIAHRIDGAATSEDTSPWPVQSPAQQLRLGLSVVAPVDTRVIDQARQARGHMNKRASIRAAGLQEQHTHIAPRGQAIGKHTPGGTATDDYVVVFTIRHVQSSFVRYPQ